MNQKEYELIAGVIRDRKENASQLYHFGYSQKAIDDILATIQDFEYYMASKLLETYDSFDLDKFYESCKL